jgi:hypothetical protein
MISWRQKTIVELELRLRVANLCLAVLSREEGRLRECKDLLVDKVCELIAAAEQREKELL